MKPEEINRAIATACGWKYNAKASHYVWASPDGRLYAHTPDYLNDLNAMHEAEKVLTSGMEWQHYEKILKEICDIPPAHKSHRGFINATAAQRCEAFLKTIGKWEEDK